MTCHVFGVAFSCVHVPGDHPPTGMHSAGGAAPAREFVGRNSFVLLGSIFCPKGPLAPLSARWSICENFQYSPSETLKKRPRACQPHRRSPVHRLRARHAAAAPHSHLSKVYSHLKTAEWRPARRPRARRARAERACPSQLPLALQAARGPQGRCVGHCCCATPLVLVDTRASRAAFAAVPKRCSARRDTARWSGIRAAMPLSLSESTRATSRTRRAHWKAAPVP